MEQPLGDEGGCLQPERNWSCFRASAKTFLFARYLRNERIREVQWNAVALHKITHRDTDSDIVRRYLPTASTIITTILTLNKNAVKISSQDPSPTCANTAALLFTRQQLCWNDNHTVTQPTNLQVIYEIIGIYVNSSSFLLACDHRQTSVDGAVKLASVQLQDTTQSSTLNRSINQSVNQTTL